jgi:hypothetical protein
MPSPEWYYNTAAKPKVYGDITINCYTTKIPPEVVHRFISSKASSNCH